MWAHDLPHFRDRRDKTLILFIIDVQVGVVLVGDGTENNRFVRAKEREILWKLWLLPTEQTIRSGEEFFEDFRAKRESQNRSLLAQQGSSRPRGSPLPFEEMRMKPCEKGLSRFAQSEFITQDHHYA